MNIAKLVPSIYRSVVDFDAAVSNSSLDGSLLELVRIRVSQINGCAYCLDMHTIDARAAGESEQRIFTLPAWRETPFFTPRERAALALAEAVTLVADTHVPDEVYDAAAKEFTETELAELVMAIAVINTWNRIAVTSRSQAGTYKR